MTFDILSINKYLNIKKLHTNTRNIAMFCLPFIQSDLFSASSVIQARRRDVHVTTPFLRLTARDLTCQIPLVMKGEAVTLL
jgi:hypothetical protein